MEITTKDELNEAKAKLERLIDFHQYNQMLAGSSKLPIDPELMWLTRAIKEYEEKAVEEQSMYGGSTLF
jgi:hypothetical protein